MNRPWFCHEDNCECIYAQGGLSLGDASIKRGYSGFCGGRMIDPDRDTFTFREVEHANKYYLCVYTPLKGWAKFMMSGGDLETIVMIVDFIARKEEWYKCTKCERGSLRMYYHSGAVREEKLCTVCHEKKYNCPECNEKLRDGEGELTCENCGWGIDKRG